MRVVEGLDVVEGIRGAASWSCWLLYHSLYFAILAGDQFANHYGQKSIQAAPSAALSCNHCRTPFFVTIPASRLRSPSGLERYRRMICPHTAQMSTHSASKSSHQALGGSEGSGICRSRDVRRMAAETMVGTG